MSIGKRLVDLARANLTDFRQAFGADRLRELLTTEESEPVPDEGEGPSDDSLGKRAGRRARGYRDAAEEAWQKAYDAAKQRAGVRGDPPVDPGAARRRWYKALGLEPGADLQQVRRAYRQHLLKFHPDRFAQDPEKYRVATEVTRQITEAYNGLTRHLGG